MAGKHRVFDVAQDDLQFLHRYVSRGEGPARSIRRARCLLLLHQGKTAVEVAHWMEVDYDTVLRTKKRYRQAGLQAALQEEKRSGRPIKITGRQRAKITALACSKPPEGYSQWSMRLLADKIVELGYCEHISHTQVSTILKKHCQTSSDQKLAVRRAVPRNY